MAITEIIQFVPNPASKEHVPLSERLQKVVDAHSGVHTPKHYIIGSQVKDKGVIQLTSEWNDAQNQNAAVSPESGPYIEQLRNFVGEPQSLFHVAFERSAFGPNGAATANVVEYVQSFFPASQVTPDFQARIERDFSDFKKIISRGVEGRVDMIVGWVLEEQEHADIEGEKAKCFMVMTGWDSMELFEKSIDKDAFREEALPILLAWKAPINLWHVESKITNALENGA